MLDLAGGLEAFLSAGLPTGGDDVAAGVAAIESQFPTRRAAARAAGVSPETWRRWRLGTQRPGPAKRLGFAAAARYYGGLAKFRRGEWSIHAMVVISDDRRPRRLWVGKYLPAVVLDSVAALARREDWPDAAAVLMDGIGRYYTEGITFDTERDVTFDWEDSGG